MQFQGAFSGQVEKSERAIFNLQYHSWPERGIRGHNWEKRREWKHEDNKKCGAGRDRPRPKEEATILMKSQPQGIHGRNELKVQFQSKW